MNETMRLECEKNREKKEKKSIHRYTLFYFNKEPKDKLLLRDERDENTKLFLSDILIECDIGNVSVSPFFFFLLFHSVRKRIKLLSILSFYLFTAASRRRHSNKVDFLAHDSPFNISTYDLRVQSTNNNQKNEMKRNEKASFMTASYTNCPKRCGASAVYLKYLITLYLIQFHQ